MFWERVYIDLVVAAICHPMYPMNTNFAVMGAEESSEPEPTEPESFSEEEKLLLQKVFDEGKIEVLLGARQDQLQFYGKHLCGDCHLDIVTFKSKIASLAILQYS